MAESSFPRAEFTGIRRLGSEKSCVDLNPITQRETSDEVATTEELDQRHMSKTQVSQGELEGKTLENIETLGCPEQPSEIKNFLIIGTINIT